MKLSAEETFWIAAGRGFSVQPVARMIRLFDVLRKFAGDAAENPAGGAGSLPG